jgi:hypothetical protein
MDEPLWNQDWIARYDGPIRVRIRLRSFRGRRKSLGQSNKDTYVRSQQPAPLTHPTRNAVTRTSKITLAIALTVLLAGAVAGGIRWASTKSRRSTTEGARPLEMGANLGHFPPTTARAPFRQCVISRSRIPRQSDPGSLALIKANLCTEDSWLRSDYACGQSGTIIPDTSPD